jgi:hypothetical protein
VTTADGRLHADVEPRLPLQVERLTRAEWRPVARSRGIFDRRLGPGSYRVTVLGGSRYAAEVSRPVAVHQRAVGP